jgi:putative membrane protein
LKFIIRIIVNAIALWITTLILPAIQIQGGILNFLIVALIFGLVNALIRPIVKLFSLPITVVTLGLFTLVINAVMLGLTSWLVGSIMSIEGSFLTQLWWAFVGAIIISLVSMVLNWFLPDKKD